MFMMPGPLTDICPFTVETSAVAGCCAAGFPLLSALPSYGSSPFYA